MRKGIAGALAVLLVSPEIGAVRVWAAAEAVATWDSIEVKPDQVRLGFSRPVRYHSFLTGHPPRLVVELLDAKHNLSTKSGPGAGKYLLRVRSGQFELSPKVVSRLVADLSQSTAYQITASGNDLVIDLNGGSQAARPAPAVEAAPRLASAQDAGSSMDAGELGDMAAAVDAVAAAPAVPAPAETAARIEPIRQANNYDIMSNLPRDKITLDFDGTDVKDVIKLMAAKAKINIIAGQDVAGPLTLHLVDVPFGDAFNTILTMTGLTTTQLGENILRVAAPAALSRERAVGANATKNITKVIPLKFMRARDVQAAVDSARTNEGRQGSTVVDNNTNSLILTEPIDSMIASERIINQIDIKPKQVLIEVKFVEIQLRKGFDVGIQWDYFQSESGKAMGKEGLTTLGTPILPSASRPTVPFNQSGSATPGGPGTGGVNLPATNILGAFTLGRVTNNYFLNVRLTAAASEGRVKLLSDPKIATLNNQRANIALNVSDPYLTTSVTQGTGGTTTAPSVQSAPSGITLIVTPVIMADGRINLELDPTVTNTEIIPLGGGNTGPRSNSRTAHSVILVKDGETIVIGGLIRDTLSNTVSKIPVLGDIPLLGWLFKSKSTSRIRTELLIFVTPKILQD